MKWDDETLKRIRMMMKGSRERERWVLTRMRRG
jgi:hypothetical protein